MTDKQRRFIVGVSRVGPPRLSAMEASDDKIWQLLEAREYVKTYLAVGGTHVSLTKAGRNYLKGMRRDEPAQEQKR